MGMDSEPLEETSGEAWARALFIFQSELNSEHGPLRVLVNVGGAARIWLLRSEVV